MRILGLPLAVLAFTACERHAAATHAAAPNWNAAAGDVTKHAATHEPQFVLFHPMTSDVEVLEGDPAVAGQPFVIRIHELAGTMVPAHRHPVDEHITIIRGTWYFGIGDEFDKSKLKALPEGSYAFAPAGSTMFAYSPGEAIVQVHGIGPFNIDWKHGVHTYDDPGAMTFRFHRGDKIQGPLGVGTVREVYASGAIVQYEVEGATGPRFMINEGEAQAAK